MAVTAGLKGHSIRNPDMHLALIVFGVAAQLVTAEPEPSAAAEEAAPAAAAIAPQETMSASQAWGIALVAAGASVAAASTVAFTLIEGVTTPDRESNPISASAETCTQAAGFTTVALASVSAVAVVVGAALILIDDDQPGPALKAATTTTAPPQP